jgi:YD repeat-containing protein
VKDAENKTWSFGYNDLGRLTSQTDHSGKTTTYKPTGILGHHTY